MKILLAGLTLLVFLQDASAQGKKFETFNFIAFGDMPYTLPQDYPRFENLIKTVNGEHQAFTVNVGDIKASTTPCSEASYQKMFNYFQQFNKPLIYTPGDNEWTDCSKKEAGSFDPEERLDVLRKIFFKDHTSFGKEKIALISQSSTSEFSNYAENNRWDFGNISFATLHVVGTNNNFQSASTNGNKEFFDREKADLSWLDDVFENAKLKNNSGVVLFIHADMFDTNKNAGEANGFTRFKNKLQDLVADFKKPVLLVNGDSHVFLVDKPIYENVKTKKAVDNFTRVQVHGDSNMHAVKVTVNPSSSSLFQIEELRVAGN